MPLVTALVGGCYGGLDAGAGSSSGDSGAVEEPDASADPAEPSAADPQREPSADLDPGTVVLRRLSRTEYDNSVRDLFGTELRPARSFPEDATSEGFDNIAATLTIAPLHVERYQAAADALVADVMARPAARASIFVCSPPEQEAAPCLADIVAATGRRIWRRDLEAHEIDGLVELAGFAAAQGEPFEGQVAHILRALLMSPHFLYRVEIDPEPDSEVPHRLSGYELATRLSYWVWSSTPDDALLDAARDGRLDDDEGIREQVARLLADPRADALITNFAEQWLTISGLAEAAPDSAAYPEFDEELRASMRAETQALVREVFADGLALETLLDADFTQVDARLAAHYGLPGGGRVTLDDAHGRRGLLGHASIQTLTSLPNRTAPVLRGKWILDNLLCTPPPPPPPDADVALDEETAEGSSLREILEEHRDKAECAACHDLMDPLGLAMENYDAIGRLRSRYLDGAAVETAGQMPGEGASFEDSRDMAELIAADPRFRRCVGRKLMTYGLGRMLKGDDRARIQSIAARSESLPEMLEAIAVSEPFTHRRGVTP